MNHDIRDCDFFFPEWKYINAQKLFNGPLLSLFIFCILNNTIYSVALTVLLLVCTLHWCCLSPSLGQEFHICPLPFISSGPGLQEITCQGQILKKKKKKPYPLWCEWCPNIGLVTNYQSNFSDIVAHYAAKLPK